MPLQLYYFHDPMCSWCWAFRPLWQEIAAGLLDHVNGQRVLGGLVPDTDQAQTTQTKKREDFQTFMDQVVVDLPEEKELLVILDNYCTHKKNDD